MSIQRIARGFAGADDQRAWLELSCSVALYLAGFALAITQIGNPILCFLGVLLIGAMLLRIYIIQHDCSHRAFFSSRKLNDIVGTIISGISMTPYEATKHIHLLHHSHVSDLDRRDTFEIYVMTVDEWEKASPLRRVLYRLYRSPLTLILIGPFLFFLLVRRIPLVGFKTGLGNLILHNLLVLGKLSVIYYIAGWAGIGLWLGAVYLASIAGAHVSYVVHNFEEIHWGTKPELDFETAALEGSSVLDWGRFFHLITMNIGYHDLHHLNAKIPGYRLREAHQAIEAQGLLTPHKIGFLDGIRCLRWKLYDQAKDRMIPFPNSILVPSVIPAE